MRAWRPAPPETVMGGPAGRRRGFAVGPGWRMSNPRVFYTSIMSANYASFPTKSGRFISGNNLIVYDMH